MQILKADTAVKVVIGPVVAVGDGFTPVTTLSLSTADEAEMMKHDAAAVTDISGNTFAAITGMDGYYNLTITAAQLDTEGMLTVGINDDSLCLPVRHDFMVVNANVYDSLYAAAATDYLQTDVAQWNSVALSTTNPLPNADAGAAGGLPTDSTGKTSFNDITTAQVNAEVVDVLKTDTIAEMAQQTPPTTPTFEEAVMYLYMALTKKIDVTATLKEFHNNAGTVIWKKTLSDDGTTYSEANGATGP